MAKQQHLSMSFHNMLDAALDTPLSIIDRYDSSQKPLSRQQSQIKGEQEDARPDSPTVGQGDNQQGDGSPKTTPPTLAIVVPAGNEDHEEHKSGSARSKRRSFNGSVISRRSSPVGTPIYVAYQRSQPSSSIASPDERSGGEHNPSPKSPAVASPPPIPTASSVYSPELINDSNRRDNRRSIRRPFNESIIVDASPEFGSPRYVACRGTESGKSIVISPEDASKREYSPSGPPTSLYREGTGSPPLSSPGPVVNPFSDDNASSPRSIVTISRISSQSNFFQEADSLPLGENRLRYGMRR